MARFTRWLARPTPSHRRPIRLEQLENREVPAVITVNSLADNITVDGFVTLREAIQAAETDTSVDGSTAGSGADIIRFDPTLFGQTINLSLVGDTTFGPTALSISSDITIDGLTGYTSGSGVTIARDSGVSNLRLFLVTSTGSLTLEGVTLSGGRAVGEDGGTSVNYGGGGGGGAAGFGGAVFNQGVLSITSSTLTGNQAQGGNSGVAFDSGVGAGTGGIGGGPTGGAGGVPGLPIAPDAGDGGFGSGGGGGGYERGKGGTGGFGGGGGGAATGIVGGVRGDAGFGGGAGGFNFGGGTAGSNGGAGAGMGGAVFNHGGILVLTNSTLAGNAAVGGTGSGTADSGAGMGGGVFSRNGSVTILNSTISGNTSAQGGRGVFLVGDGATVTYAVNNTIVGEANTTVTDVVVQTINSGSTSASGGNNIIRSTSGVSGLTGTLTADPVLGSLTNNGGPTPTMAIGTSSPAVNAGSNAALGGLSKDQRNMTVGRIDGTAVDIGAYELDIIPAVVSVSVPANGTYLASQNLDFTVTFDDTVVVTGVPRIALTVGGSTVYANYQSGTGTTALQFRYTVQAGDADADGIAMTSPIDLNSGTIQDPTGNNATLTFTPPNTSAVRVDAAPPTVASHTWPANATYVAGQHLDFTITYSENVTVTGTPRIPLTIGSTPVFANYLTGSGGTSITFRYTVQTGDLDTDGILVSLLEMNGGTIRDAAGNDADSSFGYPSTAGVRVDAVTPTVASVTGPTNGSYRGGQSLDFTVNFSEAVNVTGTPRIALTVGTNTVFATYQSGSGSTALLFRYTVQAGDTDADGIAVISPIDLNGGLISDLVANNAVLTFTPPDTSSVLVDTTTPAVSSVVRVGGATTNAGSVQYTVTFSESVTGVDVSDFMLTTTGAVSGASVTGVSGSGTTYTVTVDTGTGDGTIRLDVNTAAGTDAAGNTSTGFSASEVYSIDKTAPTVVSVVRVSSATTYSPTVQFTVTFSEDMTGVDLSDFTLSATDLTGASVLSVSGSGTTFTVTVGTGSNTASTAGTLRLDVNSASSTDVAGNALAGGFTAGEEYTVWRLPVPNNSFEDTLDLAGWSVSNGTGTGSATVVRGNGQATNGSAYVNLTLDIQGGPLGRVESGPTIQSGLFSMAAGETIGMDIRPRATADDAQVRIYLYAADGTRVATLYDGTFAGSPGWVTVGAAAPADGDYYLTVQVGSFDASFGGALGAQLDVDNVRRGVTPALTADIPDLGNNPSVGTVTITFNQAIDPATFTTDDLVLTLGNSSTNLIDGSVTITQTSPTTFDISGLAGLIGTDGTYRLQVVTTGITTLGGTAGLSNAWDSWLQDVIDPRVTAVNRADSNPTTATTVTYTVMFSEFVTGVDASDFVLTTTGAVSGASIVSVSGSGSFYTVTVDTGSGDGTIRLDVLADGTIVDRVGNTNATFTTGQTYTINRTGPTVNLTSATPTTTNANPIRVTVIFSADVTGFDVSDLTLVNATAENFTAVDARTYTFDLIPTTEGMVSVDVAAGVAADSLGNLSQAAATFTRTFDSIAPTAAFSSATPTATNASPIPVTLTFSEGVSGFDIADLVPTNGTVSNFTMVDARTYTFDLTPTTDGPVSVDVIGFDGVTDAAGNPSGTPAIFSRTSDRTRPTPTIALAPGQNTITTQRTVLFTVTFSEPVSGFDATDVTTTGTAGGMVSVTGSGTNYTVTVSGLTVNGMVGIRVNEAGGIDAVGNGNIAGTSPEVRYNATPTGVVVGSSVGGNTVQLFDQTGQVTNTIIPFPGFLGSIQTTSADMNGDGVMDLAVGAGPGGGPHVRVFDGATGAELASFFAFDPAFTGGVNVASGDINGDGVADLIVGAGAGGGPHVKAFDGKTGAEIHSFFAFDPTFRGGVNVAVGDLDGDGRGEIVTGAGAGGGPHVKVFDGKTGAEIHSFFAFDPSFRGGVNVAVGDLDGDGRGEIVTGAGPGGGPHVKVFDGKDLTERASFMAYDLAFTGGVDVAVRDVNRDGFADLVTGAGPGGGPHVKAFDGRTFGLLQEFFAADATFNGGVYVG